MSEARAVCRANIALETDGCGSACVKNNEKLMTATAKSIGFLINLLEAERLHPFNLFAAHYAFPAFALSSLTRSQVASISARLAFSKEDPFSSNIASMA